MADLDPDSLNKLRVVDLREHLSSRGLPTSGLKADLVKRLREAILSSEDENVSGSNVEQDDEPMDVDQEQDQSTDEDIETLAGEELSNSEEDARQKAEEEALRRAAEEEAMKIAVEEEADRMAVEAARMAMEEEARRVAEEEAKRKAAEEEAKKKAAEEEEKRKAAEEEEKRKAAQEEAKRKAAEEEAKRKAAEEEAKRKAAEEEAKRKAAAEEAKIKAAEEEAKIKAAEEEAKIKAAEEEAKIKAAEEEAKIKAAEEEAKIKAAEEEARKIAIEEAAKRKASEQETRRRAAEEEARRVAEEEARRVAEEEARRVVEEEAKRVAEEEARRAAEEESMRRAAEDEARKSAEEERIKVEKRMAEEEEMRKEQERWLVEEQMRKVQEEHRRRLRAEEQRRLMEHEQRQKMLAEEQKRLIEEEQKKKLAEEQKRSLEEERQKKIAEEQTRLLEEQRQRKMVAEQKRLLEAEQLRKMAGEQKRLLEEERLRRLEEEHKLLLEEERQRKAVEEQKRVQEEEERQRRIADEQQLLADEQQILQNNEDIKLPQAIEKVLALKSERAQLLGVDPDAVVQPVAEERAPPVQKFPSVTLVTVDEDEVYLEEEEVSAKAKESKGRRRKKKKKKRSPRVPEKKEILKRSEKPSKETSVDIDIEYVQEVIDVSDPMYSQFMKIFERFKLTDGEQEKEEAEAAKDLIKEEAINNLMALRKKPMDLDDDDDDDKDDDEMIEEEKPKLSKRKLKKLSRMTVAELKQKVNRPELVEMHDVTAKDPVLLLHLKASRNTVPVPRHWCFKRKYLQGKRGIEKPAFELPDFIKRTGIMEMRQALQEKEDQKTMKAKMRERVRPKLGKIDIDYQKLHDAFFKWQTKPKMTIHGDLYYEGKEFETRLKEKKPGDLSDDLRTALGMPTGPNANKCPPPWLIAMQRYGPPPSYPNLKIPGLNAPIPDDCSFGYHAGGWGKPPVDETGRPLYGDVFGTQIAENQPHIQEEEIDHTLWGELESESSEEEEDEDEEEEEDEEEKAEDESGLVTPAEGLITPSGFSSIPAGMETPDMIELRKRKIESEIEGGETPALYTILPEKKTERVGAAMMGSTHIYDLAAAIPASKLKMPGTASVPPQGIEVALDPSELEMDSAAMAARYEQTMREQQSQLEKEDLSDMVAEHAARQKNKRKKQQLTSAKPPKKYKEFKF